MKSHFYLCSVIIGVFLTLASCHDQPDAEVIEVTGQDVPEDFADFYVQFHTDSAYQMKHILFPLDGRPAADSNQYDDPYTWEKSTWKLHNFDHFDPRQFEVTRKVTDSTLLTEFIIDKASGFGIKRRFAKFSDEWYLIYYDAMNPGQ